ncbi:hypothetical protein [Nocardia sp. NPDC052566]|uniref:hypothetical protein n=1 Tax=Nocardia sp. NPDC052566 TaxID=3364330 RepID=UPI0037C4FFDC
MNVYTTSDATTHCESCGAPYLTGEHSFCPAFMAERERRIDECANRRTGHAWNVEGEGGGLPSLTCSDCRCGGDWAYPDIMDMLFDTEYELDERTIVFGEELPDEEASRFAIPVAIRIEEVRYVSMNSIGYEYDVVVHLTQRTA